MRYWLEWAHMTDRDDCGEEEIKDIDSLYDRMDELMANGYNFKKYPITRCCNEDIICFDFTNTCPICGADYNFNGERLASREQWGEETGESWQDCY